METKYLKINPADNVAVAIVNLSAGEKLSVDGIEVVLNEDIPAGHKFALKNFAEGEDVIKYGYPIGHAQMAKKQGVTEELKATDMMRWIGLMNNIRACADEIVLNDIVYS